MCYVCLHLAFEATLFLGREGHAMHTLGEAMGEAIVLIYSFLVPMEDGWILKLGSVCVLSHFICVQLFVTQWTVACQAPLSMGSSRQEYWSRFAIPLSWWRGLTECGPLEKGVASHFSILALRTP